MSLNERARRMLIAAEGTAAPSKRRWNRIGTRGSAERTGQLLLAAYVTDSVRAGRLPDSAALSFSSFSQFDEDGILLWTASALNIRHGICLEIGAGDGIENNTANLIVNHGWRGVLIDGDVNGLNRARQFYYHLPDTRWRMPTIVPSLVTAENVNRLVKNSGLSGDIDLFSIDIDGIDYWVWKALEVVRPKVVVAEYQSLHWDHAISVPYSPGFVRARTDPHFYGANLRALVALAGEKGYTLVATNLARTNAFFVDAALAEGLFPELPLTEALRLRSDIDTDVGPGVFPIPALDRWELV